jgi:branched-chain amino acid aminotransferase
MLDTVAIDIEQVATSRIGEVDFDDLKFGKAFADHMFVADYRDGRWTDLRVMPYGDMAISPSLSGLHYGQSIFEGLKAYAQPEGGIAVFRPQENFIRLNISAERMCMPTIPEEVFFGGLNLLLSVDHNWVPRTPGGALYIRPYMFATDNFIGVRASDTYRFIIFTCPVGVYYTEPVRVKVEKQFTRAVHGGTGFTKSAGNYGGSLYPTRLAQEKGFHQVIWTDAAEHKYLEEAGTMNVMFIIDGKLVTPALRDTLLKGVTRDSIITIARDNGIEVEERPISVDELKAALTEGRISDAFGAGTAATFAPMAVINIDDMDYQLPPASEKSKVLKLAMEGIRTGKQPDIHNWLYPISW